MEEANFQTFIESWTDELEAQANRVRQLIGDAHWLSDGNHKEAILRAFLRKHLPPAVHIGTGFILNPSGNRTTSPQIDILICDLNHHTPFLLEDDLTISPSKALLANIEIKSRLSSQTAKSALNNIFLTRAAGSNSSLQPWSGIIFFATDSEETNQIAKWIKNSLKEVANLITEEANESNRFSAPICLVIASSTIIFIDKTTKTGARLRFFKAGKKSLAFGVLDLISSIRTRFGGNQTEDIDLLATDSASPPEIIDVRFEANDEQAEC